MPYLIYDFLTVWCRCLFIWCCTQLIIRIPEWVLEYSSKNRSLIKRPQSVRIEIQTFAHICIGPKEVFFFIFRRIALYALIIRFVLVCRNVSQPDYYVYFINLFVDCLDVLTLHEVHAWLATWSPKQLVGYIEWGSWPHGGISPMLIPYILWRNSIVRKLKCLWSFTHWKYDKIYSRAVQV